MHLFQTNFRDFILKNEVQTGEDFAIVGMKIVFTEVTNVEIILDEDLVSELPMKSIDDRVDRFGHKTGTMNYAHKLAKTEHLRGGAEYEAPAIV